MNTELLYFIASCVAFLCYVILGMKVSEWLPKRARLIVVALWPLVLFLVWVHVVNELATAVAELVFETRDNRKGNDNGTN